MADFRGGDVVVVPLPVKPEMVVWALPGPAGEIPYADVEALVDAEFDERIDTMTQLEQSTSQAAASATAAADEVAAAVPGVNQARDQAVQAADTATQQASIASDSASAASAAAEVAEQYALDFDLDVAATTGEPGSLATVEVSGTGPAYQIAFSIPRGEKGAKGDDGEVSQAALDAAVASLVDNAPEALDTLHELAAALGNDPNFAATTATEIGKRALIDGAPAEYDTLGKLVTALQNHELGGSTDASLLTGAVTENLNLSNGVFKLSVYDPETGQELPDEAIVMPLAEFASYMYMYLMSGLAGILIGDSLVPWTEDGSSGTAAPLHYALESIVTQLAAKADDTHTHTPADIGAEPASWTGTQAQYDALGSYDPDTTYYVIEE